VPTTRVAIYTRLSRDLTDGTQSSTDRQERLCRAHAEARGWVVGEVFCDVDLSAFQPKVARPAYEALLHRVATRGVDAVVVWRLDRLMRRSAEFERAWEILDRAGVALISVTEPIDTATATGLAVVRLLVTFAGLESTVKSQRISAKFRERAEAGLAHHGPGGFGHNADASAVIETEAALIREAGDRLLAGASLTDVAQDWTSRGITGRKGGHWRVQSLRRLLGSHRLAGDRSYLGEVVARDCFPAILDRATATRVRLQVALPAGNRGRGGALLRGRIRCGRCNAPMSRTRMSGTGNYVCTIDHWGGCGRVGVSAERVEEVVVAAVLWRLEARHPANGRRLAFRGRELEFAAAVDASAASFARLNRDYYVEGVITRGEWLTARDALLDTAGLAAPDACAPVGLPAGFDPRTVRARWADLSSSERRAVLAVECQVVVVHPATQFGPTFHPERVECRWWPHLGDPPGAPPPYEAPARDRAPDVRPAGEWLSTGEACDRRDWTRAQLHWAIKKGLPSKRVGARRWIQAAGLDDWRLPGRPAGDHLDSAGAAALLGIGRGAFQRLANRTALTYQVIASRRWYSAADVAGLIERCRIIR
jgi:DNA invertase Pin-like site-specific DNA recombinase